MKCWKILWGVQTAVLLGLTAAVITLLCQSAETHEAIRMVCRYLAGG